MVLPRNKVIGALNNKGFDEKKKRHINYYHRWKSTEKLSGITTCVSHSGKDLPKWLVGEISRDLRLKKPQLRDFVDCKIDQLKYEAIVRENPQGLKNIPRDSSAA